MKPQRKNNPFYGPGGRRAIDDEIKSYVRSRTDAMLVDGFAEMIDAGSARHDNTRASSYLEMFPRDEYLLRISDDRPMTWRTHPVPSVDSPRIAFMMSIGFGNGSPLPQPTGQWDVYVNDRFAVSVRVVNHSQLWRGGECCLAFSANRVEAAEPFGSITLSNLIQNESFAAFGPALLCVPMQWLEAGQPATIRIEPKCPVQSTRWFQLGGTSILHEASDIYRAVSMIADGPAPQVGGGSIYFGDIHAHSGEVSEKCSVVGCGRGTRRENYEYARGPGGLDFFCLADHERQIDPDDHSKFLGLADEYNRNGEFVCLPGFEFTNRLYGHRNVYFRGSGGAVFSANKRWDKPAQSPDDIATPMELWAAMEATGVPFITVPHHPSSASHPLNFDFYNPKYDRLIEIYSCWGSSEYYGDFPRGVGDRWPTNNFRDAIKRGLRCGAIASADGHDGHPGNAQSPLVKHHHLFHPCGSGRAAVFADELTREAIYDALYARRCYATTGPPIVLDVRLGDAPMGSELPRLKTGRPRLSIACRGASGIDHLRIVKNGDIVETIPCHGRWDYQLQWQDRHYNADEPAAYYVRLVQKDRESAWSSPIWMG